MSLETKGTIKYDPDVKPNEPHYIIEAKQIGVFTEGSGNLEQMVDELTERIRREISSEFGISQCDVEMVKYSMTLTFDVSAPIHKTLDQFTDLAIDVATKPDGAKIVETAAAIMEISKATGIPPLQVFDAAKAKLDAQKKKKVKGE